MALKVRREVLRVETGIRTELLVPTSAQLLHRSPASGPSPTRRSWAATPSRTRPASTSTACWPTRSDLRDHDARRASASRRRCSCSASTRASTRSSRGCKQLGVDARRPSELEEVTRKVKELADRKKFVYDDDLLALVEHAAERRRAAGALPGAGGQPDPAHGHGRGGGGRPAAHGLRGRQRPARRGAQGHRRGARLRAASCSRCTRGR